MIAQDNVATDEWAAPGPGNWARDDAHTPGTIPFFMQELIGPAMTAGFAAGFRRYGALLERLDVAFVGQRMYMRPVFVGAEQRGVGGPPPSAEVFRTLFTVNPELRLRAENAAATFAGKLWRQQREQWDRDEYPRLRAALLALQATTLDTLDAAALRAHVAAAAALLTEVLRLRFALTPASGVPVGDWLAQTRAWTNVSDDAALAALQGSSAVSVAPVAALARLAAAIRQTPDAAAIVADESGDPQARLDRLRAAGSEIGAALDAYLIEYGWRVASSLALDATTLIEMPQLLLRTVAAALEQGPMAAPEGAATAARLRAQVPPQHLAEYDSLFAEAYAMYGFRDETVGVVLWSLGLLRRALMAAGRRLVAQGAITTAADLFDATPAEVDNLLGGPGAAPTADELAGRAAERRRLETVYPPETFGAGGGPRPPLDLLPPAIARLTRAQLTFTTLMDGEQRAASPASSATLRGNSASGGRYTGRACVVTGPADFARISAGDVLVARTTSPNYNILLPLLGAVVTERGGALSHAALVAREFGIPAVVGVTSATTLIPDGCLIVVDGDHGSVEILA